MTPAAAAGVAPLVLGPLPLPRHHPVSGIEHAGVRGQERLAAHCRGESLQPTDPHRARAIIGHRRHRRPIHSVALLVQLGQREEPDNRHDGPDSRQQRERTHRSTQPDSLLAPGSRARARPPANHVMNDTTRASQSRQRDSQPHPLSSTCSFRGRRRPSGSPGNASA